MRSFLQLFAPCLLFATASWAAVTAEGGTDFFEKSVRPILVERCYDCHSAEKKVKGGLRLDFKGGWEKGGDTGPAIVPGKTEESLLVEAIRYGNHDLQMPPKQQMPPEETAVLERWVREGAPDPREVAPAGSKKSKALSLEEGRKIWCYAPVKKSEPPAVKDEAWAHDGIDRFILAKLEAAGIAPAADAAPADLARRLYFTLIGLPPTPEQVAAFCRDAETDRPGAIARLAEELIARPQFGEAWGRHWLDVARFAESSGGGRTLLFKDAWHYRDYVIDAFNADVPFDRFIREQLAGDLLPAATPEDRRRQTIATAFLALGPTNYEEQDKQQLRFDVIDEQIDTVGRAFLGQTIACARCHDHKFDPIPQRDYYALAGIFASTRTLQSYTTNVARWISAPLPGAGGQEAILQAQETKQASLEKELAEAKVEAAKYPNISDPDPGKPIAANRLPGLVLDDTDAKVVGEWKHSKVMKPYIGAGYLSDNNDGKGGKTVTFTPIISKTAKYEVRLAYTSAPDRAKNVRVNILHADGEDTVFVDESKAPPADGRFVSLGKFRFEKEGAGYVLITNENTEGFVTVDALQLLPEEAAAAEANANEGAEGKQARQRVTDLEAELKNLKTHGVARETAMAVHDDTEAIGDTNIRVRGIEKNRGDQVPRGFLQIALQAPPTVPADASGRREMAEWIASPQNPLTARVIVNRVWGWLFGSGIVRTVDLFSTTGEAPSNPELIDYLATRFMSEGWSIKRLVREIVLSHTWQEAVAKSASQDPENRLFAHANRRRLDADQLRDAILAVSGSLDLTTSGPNITGAGDIDANNFSAQNIEYGYVFADTRRSVYTPAFRNKRLELFEAFDFADANQSYGQRLVSTVAPQALYLLNHPFMLEQSERAAKRTLEAASSDEDRLEAAFRTALGRPPSPAEREKCLAFLRAGAPGSPESWAEVEQILFACLDFRYFN